MPAENAQTETEEFEETEVKSFTGVVLIEPSTTKTTQLSLTPATNASPVSGKDSL